MACGCLKKNSFTQTSPLVIGEANGAPAQQFRATITFYGVKPGDVFLATGSGIPQMMGAWITPVG
jgi:hypothetical protein